MLMSLSPSGASFTLRFDRYQLQKAAPAPISQIERAASGAALTLHACRAVQPPVSACGVLGSVVVLELGAVLWAGAEAVTVVWSFDALSFMEQAIALPANASSTIAVSETRSLCMAFLLYW
jgi:hypothetical protein